MTWQALVLINALCMGVGTILTRSLARDRHYQKASFAVNAYQYLFLWGSGLLFLPELGRVDPQVVSTYFWHFVLGGLSFAMLNVTLYKTLTYVDAAVGSIFNTLSVVFTIGLAAVVLNQRLTAIQLVGSAVLMVAIMYSMLAMRKRSAALTKKQFEAGLTFSVLSGLFFAIAIVNEQWLLERMSAGSYVVFGWGWQVLGAWLLAVLFQRKKLSHVLHGAQSRTLALSGAVRGIGGAAFVLAQIRSSNVALITVIANLRLIVVMVFGIWLLKEHKHMRQKTTGTIAALLGLTIIFWK